MMKEHDLVESEAWTDFSNSAPVSTMENCGIKVFPVGGVYATMTSKIDVIAFNRVVGLGINKPIDDRIIDIILNKIETYKVERFFIQVHPEVYSDDIRKLLVSKNFYHYNNWVRLIRDNSPAKKTKTNLNIKTIEVNESKASAQIVVNAFEWPEELVDWIAAPVGRKKWHHYMAFENNVPVATAAFYLGGEYAWFDFAATHPQHRGKGAQSALLAERIEDCRALGVKEMIVETAEQTTEKESPSYRNVLKSGFKEAYKRPNFLFVNK
jgi:GNAT superfamily N-acetyltransferase